MKYKLHLSNDVNAALSKLPALIEQWLRNSLLNLEDHPLHFLKPIPLPSVLPEYVYNCERKLPDEIWEFHSYVNLTVSNPSLTYVNVRYISQTYVRFNP